MSFWVLVQVFVNLVLFAGVALIWVKLHRPAKDDPRLSRGLQLLQSKISVLEDLADRTETQAGQLTALMEQKVKDIQTQVVQADKQIQRIEASMGKSLEVAKIFQDKIPHQEIIERQNTIKYVRAARLAHQGLSVDEIAAQVDLSRGEIEFIAKVNRDQLQFSEEDLPEWAKDGAEETISGLNVDIIEQPAIAAQMEQKRETISKDALSQLGDQFRKALSGPATGGEIILSSAPTTVTQKAAPAPAKQAAAITRAPATGDPVKKVVFPKIDINNNLG